MCGASEGSEQELNDDEITGEKDYIRDPFPEDEFEPVGWRDILATLDVCVNDLTSTKFCDEEGYDLMMIRVILEPEIETQECLQPLENVKTNENMDEEVIQVIIECPPYTPSSIETIITSKIGSTFEPNKKPLMLTSSNVQEEAQSCVVV